MTKQNFMHFYHILNGSQGYDIFFERKGFIYYIECARIAPRWVKEGRESKSKGGAQKFRMYIPTAERDKLIAKGATLVMSSAEFKALPYRNKGHKCEYYLHQLHNIGEYKPDNLRFDKGGDICVNGIQYQVKFQNATLTNVDVLHKAQADARERRKAERKMGK